MQFVVESEWSFAVFVTIALVMMMAATYIIFISKRAISEGHAVGATPTKWRWAFKPGRLLPTIIAFGMMFIGMALVGAWYYVQVPIVSDYMFNIMAVTLVACILAAVAAYGIALIGLYAKSPWRK